MGRRSRNIHRRQLRGGPPRVRWDPLGATRRKKTMILVGLALFLTSDFDPARRLGDGWTSILAFGPLGETQIACRHVQRSRSKRWCTRPLQRNDGGDLSVAKRSEGQYTCPKRRPGAGWGQNLTFRRPRRRSKCRKRPTEIIVILRRVAPNGSHLTLGGPHQSCRREMFRNRRLKFW